jgi:MFS family permease
MYSLFTCVTAFAQNWWQMAILRFLVAMGTGGEWAVASAMVAEVFPKRARAWSLGIFHASSVLGTYLAVLAGVFVVGNYALAAQVGEVARSVGSVFGESAADFLGTFLASPWRLGFLIGAFPALLTLVIRWKLREPEQWIEARAAAAKTPAQKPGRLADLFQKGLIRNTLVGITLATIGLATFWGVHIYGRELLRTIVERPYLAEVESEIEASVAEIRRAVDAVLQDHEGAVPFDAVFEAMGSADPRSLDALRQALPERAEPIARDELEALPAKVRKKMTTAVLAALPDKEKRSVKRWEMLGMFLVTTGGGLGLLSFGPVCEWIGRRPTFLLFHLGGLASGLIVFQGMSNVSATALCWMLPVFGYLTLGMHAGYAIYFPELFPTRLRGTGGGFCFNGGRFLAASILVLRGWMRNDQGLGLSLESTASILSLLFLLGVFVLLAAPETKGRDLPT